MQNFKFVDVIEAPGHYTLGGFTFIIISTMLIFGTEIAGFDSPSVIWILYAAIYAAGAFLV